MKKQYAVLLVILVMVMIGGCKDATTVLVSLNPKNMLYLETCGNDGSAYARVWFPAVSEFGDGATGYVLQSATSFEGPYSNLDGHVINADSVGYDVPVPSAGAWFRLAIEDGTFDGESSNRVFATQCVEHADLQGWSLDESVGNTGVIAPQVGYGLLASFTVMDREPDPDTQIDNPFNYQWYRVNPNDWEDEELVVGATALTYTTTTADRGYQMLVKATGNENFQGGFAQLYSQNVVGEGAAITP